jgi:hypothetical protein
MVNRFIVGLLAGTALFATIVNAQAACTGVAASNEAFDSFQKNPSSLLAPSANGSLSSNIKALAITASANPDKNAPQGQQYSNFQNAIKNLLSGATSDQAKTIGSALGSLASVCGKAGVDETAFITAVQNGIAGSSNQFADAAYGKALNEPQTAATGGGGGGASSGNGGPTGGADRPNFINTGGVNDQNFGTPNNAQNYFSINNAGGGGVLTSNQ